MVLRNFEHAVNFWYVGSPCIEFGVMEYCPVSIDLRCETSVSFQL